MGWNMISEIEEIELKPAETPDLLFALFSDAVIVDHETGTLLLVANIFIESGSALEDLYEDARQRLDTLLFQLSQAHKPFLANQVGTSAEVGTPNMSKETFLGMVEKAKHYVQIGDVFQVVLSQRFDYGATADALAVYRVLRALNPSPYMYLLNGFDDSPFAVVGSSPEALVKISNRHAITHPIAGSRPRGANWDADLHLEQDLVADEKERAEHLMLVDLARNDLLKVCRPDSISVSEFMQVHKFSHIQHLVSTVEGDLREDVTPVDVFKATFPAGTLSGAPKPRALEIISELEPDPRGIYGGVVGYFDFSDNADLAIAIRTLVLREGRATVQAGAGIVLDSNPNAEYDETVSKASAPARAIARANDSRRIS
jgi:anthranilate synthase component 1